MCRLLAAARYYPYLITSYISCMQYELGVAICSPRIVWSNGPFLTSVHDITVFHGGMVNRSEWGEGVLCNQFPIGVKCVGDSGHGGKPNIILVKKQEHSMKLQRFIKHALSRHESLNKRIKDFKIMNNQFCYEKFTEDHVSLPKMIFRLFWS